MLELIALLSLALGKLDGLAGALALLVVNAVIAFVQEQRASAAVDALRQRMQVMARVLRDGRWQLLAARELVRGDVVRLRAGDFVPADLRLDAGALRLDSSALPGATDVAKGAASVVLTDPGLASIVPRVDLGRATCQRILTWILNKISGTILKSACVAVALATDRVRPLQQPETWAIGGQVRVAVVLEALLLMWAGWTWLGLAGNPGVTNTFAFLTLLYFAIASILSLRERRWFGASRPSAALAAALSVEGLVGTVLSYTGLAHSPAWQTLIVAGGAAVACLGVNDAIKVAMIRRLGPTAVPSP
jgi:hypothetical protein